jgi:hypothetical protein
MTKPIPDKAEVALEYPDKLYIGTFERTARFDAHLDETGISLSLHRIGAAEERKSVRMHFHYELFADILRDLATTAARMPPDDAGHREAVREAAKDLYVALGGGPDASGVVRQSAAQKAARRRTDDMNMTPEEEVLLLHVLE